MEQTIALNSDGFRVVAVAYKEMDPSKTAYSVADEADLTLLGYIAFLDPPKESAREAIAALASKGVQVKILTGDNEVITRKICHEVQLDVGEILLGGKMAQMSDAELADIADRTTVFAKLTPAQKERVVRALHAKGHVVGFLGDGINDSPALKTADVGISVDTAVDIAKESADIILLEKNLLVLRGRRHRRPAHLREHHQVHQNGRQLEFRQHVQRAGRQHLPAVPADGADPGADQQPAVRLLTDDDTDRQRGRGVPGVAAAMGHQQHLQVHGVHRADQFDLRLCHLRHDAVCVPCLDQPFAVPDRLVRRVSSHANPDHPYHQDCEDSVHRKPRQPCAHRTTLIICAIGIALPFTWVGSALGFTPLPWLYWPLVGAMLLAYAILTHFVKVWFIRRWGL